MQIGSREICEDHPPYVIAEIGVNHDGSSGRILELTKQAFQAGAHAVKFQYFTADALMSSDAQLAAYQTSAGESNPLEMLKRLEIEVDSFAPAIALAHDSGGHAIVTLFSSEHVSLIEPMGWDAFKVASPDIINLPLLDALRSTGTPIIVSTGAATEDEIQAVVDRGCANALLHCVSAYPTPIEQTQLRGIQLLTEMVCDSIHSARIAIGYSDHTTSCHTSRTAVAAGAVILEKHFTDDCSRAGPDHQCSLNPRQFKLYVDGAHEAWTMLGTKTVAPQTIEQDVRSVSRQSIVTVRDLAAGHVLQNSDLTIKRPGTGLSPKELTTIVGMTLSNDVAANTVMHASDVCDD